MAELPSRPELPGVFAALTDSEPELWSNRPHYRIELRRASYWVAMGNVGWVDVNLRVDDPADAMRLLCELGITPEPDARRRFLHFELAEAAPGIFLNELREVVGAAPKSIPILVAWASLGRETILRAEELARDTAQRLAPWGVTAAERVVWHAADKPLGWILGGWPFTATLQVASMRAFLKEQSSLRARDVATEGERWWIAHRNVWDSPLPCPSSPIVDLHALGLGINKIGPDGVRILVPPIGGAP